MKKINVEQLADYIRKINLLPEYFKSIVLLKIKDQKYSQFYLDDMYQKCKFLEKFAQTK